MLVAFIAFLIAVGLSVGFSVLISQPFSGAIVRLRANYLPKAISLDNVLEDGGASGSPRAISAFLLSERRSTAKIGPVITGVFSMLKRTKRLEGWAGVYKGSAPVALQLVLLSFLTFIFFSVESAWSAGSTYKAAPSAPGEFGFFTNLLFMVVTSLVALPLNVITYRYAGIPPPFQSLPLSHPHCLCSHCQMCWLLCIDRTIVHPRILPWNKPRENLKELLSYSEYAQPWRLYQLPGLLAANFAHVAWIGLATRIVRQLTVPALGGLDRAQPAAPGQDTYEGPNSKMLEISSFGLAVFVSWNVLSVVVLAPLECVMVRLSTQRPERQNPLHRAYARVPNSASGAGSSAPAPYSHQATVSAQTQPGGAYTDAEGQNEAGRRSTDKPLPSSPDGADEPSRPRPSFAIEDDEDEDGAHGPNGMFDLEAESGTDEEEDE